MLIALNGGKATIPRLGSGIEDLIPWTAVIDLKSPCFPDEGEVPDVIVFKPNNGSRSNGILIFKKEDALRFIDLLKPLVEQKSLEDNHEDYYSHNVSEVREERLSSVAKKIFEELYKEATTPDEKTFMVSVLKQFLRYLKDDKTFVIQEYCGALLDDNIAVIRSIMAVSAASCDEIRSYSLPPSISGSVSALSGNVSKDMASTGLPEEEMSKLRRPLKVSLAQEVSSFIRVNISNWLRQKDQELRSDNDSPAGDISSLTECNSIFDQPGRSTPEYSSAAQVAQQPSSAPGSASYSADGECACRIS